MKDLLTYKQIANTNNSTTNHNAINAKQKARL